MTRNFEYQVRKRGMELYEKMGDVQPALFREKEWTGRTINHCLQNMKFKGALLRFIDVLPVLTSDDSIITHFAQYFCRPEEQYSHLLDPALQSDADFTGKNRERVLRIVDNIKNMGRIFIAATEPEEMPSVLHRLRSQGSGISADILGEAVVSEREADEFLHRYLNLLDLLNKDQKNWPGLGMAEETLDWGFAPRIDISIKPSSLYSQMHGAGFDGIVVRAKERLRRIFRRAKEIGAHITLDMEYYDLKNITLALYRSLLDEEEFRGYPYTGLVLQSYLRECEGDLREIVAWAEAREQRLTVRLVKGAYWEAETVIAPQKSWPYPVYMNKYESDASFESSARYILENHRWLKLACASQNIRSVAYVMELIKNLKVPADRYEYQVIYGMAEPLQKALVEMGFPLRVYTPVGRMIPGMAYLIRRLLENTARGSFLSTVYSKKSSIEELLVNPQDLIDAGKENGKPHFGLTITPGKRAFKNEPLRDWGRKENRERMFRALENVRKDFPFRVPLIIRGKRMSTRETFYSINPDDPTETVGIIAQATEDNVDAAVAYALEAFPHWRDTLPATRANYLFRAAEVARIMRDELVALEVYEVGKSWMESDADVCEAIDYLEYYGRQMLRLGTSKSTMKVPGEKNTLFYEPRGAAVVIAPWNFPLAISTGMTSAALATGNTVVYKPSSQSAVTGFMLYTLFNESGLPPGVLNFLPGPGSTIGDQLVDHPDVALIAFTGSKDVGLHIVEHAYRTPETVDHVKHVVAEMGGKNAIIVDSDADLDEVVVGIIQSAFGYQGQKCSACSRLVVVQDVYENLLERLKAAAESIVIGSPEDPFSFIGPVIDRAALEKVKSYIEIGRSEGQLVLNREDEKNNGFRVPITIFTDIRPEHRLAREEIFGPVLAVLKVPTFKEALDIVLMGDYALTGSIYSRSPEHIARAQQIFRVGNLYINRKTTGAMIGRHPFGGFKLSGLGSKAGGPDYLKHFMIPRTVSENTFRRGFAPPL
jgi:RHH-type proline utilization regulon transcriptional repressor/proline dehydrogenase/delta 1-pyrroline-5-carboxylate dehydrogenase